MLLLNCNSLLRQLSKDVNKYNIPLYIHFIFRYLKNIYQVWVFSLNSFLYK